MNDGVVRCAHGRPCKAEPAKDKPGFMVDIPECAICLFEIENGGFAPIPYLATKPLDIATIQANEEFDEDDVLLVDNEGDVVAKLNPDDYVVIGLPETAAERKQRPICRGVLDYFPDALAEVAYTSYVGNEQHNPGQPLHWAKGKSTDHEDALVRHLMERGKIDSDGVRHSAKVAWRALAMLQTEIESEREGVK